MIEHQRLQALYDRATMEVSNGDLGTWAYLSGLSNLAEGSHAEMSFFADGDAIGYTPGIAVDYKPTRTKLQRLPVRKITLGFCLGFVFGSLAIYAATSKSTKPQIYVRNGIEEKVLGEK